MSSRIMAILAVSAVLLTSCVGIGDMPHEKKYETAVPEQGWETVEDLPFEAVTNDVPGEVTEEVTAEEQENAEEDKDIPTEDHFEEKDEAENEEKKEYKEEKEAVPKKTPEGNLVDSMSDEERMNVSIFLSNLSEAEFTFDSDIYGETENLINFAYIHANINSQSMIITDGEYEGLSAANVDNILDRFFGYTVPHKTPENSKRWIYRNGNFLVPAAAGASFADFSIVTGMTKRDDGNFNVRFNVYTDPTIGGGNFITDKNIYYLTDSEAAERFEYSHSGRAVLRVKKRNGKDAYEIVSYTLDNGTSSKN
ncbi:MAG: hypothetical protein E7583_09805 [Ruminococcaceae bacterium]|nr:hypothetical protein [Oscillospiraceae bacterium]